MTSDSVIPDLSRPRARGLLRRRWLWWALFFGFWTLLGLFDANQTYFYADLLGRPMPLVECLVLCLAQWYGLGGISLLLIALGDRLPFDQRQWKARLTVLLVASAAASLVKVVLDIPVERMLRTTPGLVTYEPTLRVFQVFFTGRFLIYLIIFWAILGVSHALDYYRKYRERELRAAQLEARLVQAELQMLKMQLHPHFLFNTLHAISCLIHQDVDVADRMIARLGELLRTTLENAGVEEVTLRQELDFVRPYLEIEQARIGPRLVVHLDVAAEALDAWVPYLILQPLVENAIRHGVAVCARAGRVEVRARRDAGRLRLQVRDDGPGLSAEQKAFFREGVGVSNTRARLQQLYGADQSFEMTNGPGGGLTVTLTLPYRGGPDDKAEPAGGDDVRIRTNLDR